MRTFERSAPVKPGVRRASTDRSTEPSSGLFRAWTSRMATRPATSGASTTIWRSNRPGRSSAGSKMSGRLVAAMRITPVAASNPSISTSSWLRVCSRSSWPPPTPVPRCRPTASISSTKMIAGACETACLNRSRTRLAPTPTNISTKSEPEMVRKGTSASPATARASSVLPVPGGPDSSTPFGIRAPSWVNRDGSFRNSTISPSSMTASSAPATSANVTLSSWPAMRALARPNRLARPPPCICIANQRNTPITSTVGTRFTSRSVSVLLAPLSAEKSTSDRSSWVVSRSA